MDLLLYIINVLLSVISSFFVIATTIVFLHCFYDPGFIWHKKKAIFLIFYVLLDVAITNLPYSDLWLLVASCYELVIGVGVVVYDYPGKRLLGAFRYLWVYSLIGLCATIISEIGGQYIFPGHSWLTANATWGQALLVCFLYALIFGFVFFYLYYRIYRKNILLPWKKRERIFVVVYSVACVALYIIIEGRSTNNKLSLIILGACFILTAILVPIFFYYLRISEYFQIRTKHQEGYMQAELEHFQQYKLTQEETARFRHDTKNHLLCVSEMLQQGKTQEANAYLKELLEVVENLSVRYVTGDEILDSIVAAKAGLMAQKGISFQLDGVIAGGLPWKSVDVCNVFANALDNAIEACETLPQADKRITMKIKATPQFWFVHLENPVLEKVDTSRLFKKTNGYTSKENANLHGIGTYNIKHTVESYGGAVQAQYEDRKFVLEIMIDKK